MEKLPLSSKKILGIPISAYLESILFLSLLVLFNHFFGDGTRYLNVSPHPFWIIVLLVTVQYGTLSGLMCTFLATLFLYAGNIPSQTVDESFFEYQLHLALLPTLWFTASFILGEIRVSSENEKSALKKELEKTQKEAETITESYNLLKNNKEDLEMRLATQLKTSTMIYSTFKFLSTLNPASVLLNLNQVIQPTINPKKFSVYTLGPNGFESSICYGWQDNDKYLRRFFPNNLLYQEIVGKHRLLCIANSEDEKILAGEGIMAASLVDPESKAIFGMLKIEEIDFLELSISNIETFKTVCELIGMAYANARKYKKTEENALYSLEAQEIYSYAFYKIQCEYLKKLCEQANQALSAIEVKIQNIPQAQTDSLRTSLWHLMLEILPVRSQVFLGKSKRNEFIILAPLTDAAEAEKMTLRILEKAQKNDALNSIKFNFKIVSLTAAASSGIVHSSADQKEKV